jgi:hypothetical protein
LFTVIFHVVYQDQVLRISDVVLLGILIFMRMSTDLFEARTQARPVGQARRSAKSGDARGRWDSGDGNAG